MLAIVWAVKHFWPYLYGQRFRILSDHKPLQWAFKVQNPSLRLLRWHLQLAEHECLVNYIPGKDNAVADALSHIRAITTRKNTKNVKPFEHRPFKDSKDVAVLSSPDRVRKNPFFSGLKYSVSQVNEMEKCTMGNKTIYLVSYRSSARSPFSTEAFRQILTSLRQLMLKDNCTEIGLFDNFNAISKFRFVHYRSQNR